MAAEQTIALVIKRKVRQAQKMLCSHLVIKLNRSQLLNWLAHVQNFDILFN